MPPHESHPLLNASEFKDELAALGYTRSAGGGLFGRLVRLAVKERGQSPQSAEDIAYTDVDGVHGVPGAVVSIPNMHAAITRLGENTDFYDGSIEMCRRLAAKILAAEE